MEPGRTSRRAPRAMLAAVLTLALAGPLGFAMPSWSAETMQARPDMTATLAAVLQDSAAAWSRGDLDGFMRCYEDAPDTTYVNAAGLVQGYQAIHDMYAARFTGGAGAMGRLSTSLIATRRLGPDYALAYGRYRLHRAGGDATGLFSLIFHRSGGAWKIVSDHTA